MPHTSPPLRPENGSLVAYRGDEVQRAQAEQIRLLFRYASTALFANLLNGLLLVAATWQFIPRHHLLAWLAILAAVSASRWELVRAFRRAAPCDERIAPWARRYVVGALVAGCVWGAGGVMMVLTGHLAYQAFSVFVLGGMAVGAITTSTPLRTAYFAITLPMLIPTGVLLLMEGDRIHLVMGILTLLFAGLLAKAVGHLHDTLHHSLVLRFANDALVEDLTHARDDLQHSNQELAREVTDRRHAQARLAESEQRFRTLSETTTSAIFVYRDGFEYVNPAAERISGYTAEELRTMNITDLVHPDDRSLVAQRARLRLAGQEVPGHYEIRIITKDGRQRWVSLTAAVVNYGGAPAGLGTAVDITEHKRIETELVRQRDLAQVPLASIGDGVVTTDVSAGVEYLNPVAEQLTGWSQAEARGQLLPTVLNLVDEATREAIPDPVRRALMSGSGVRVTGHTLLLHRDGDRQFSVEVTTAPIRDPDDHVIGVAVVFHDITALRDLTRQMSYQASHDGLTGLANRREFEQRLERAVESARHEGVEHALCYIDLDQFKIVNDTCGHVAGDQLLKQLAGMLRSRVREGDALARLGGDEFGLLLQYCGLDKAQDIAEGLRQAIEAFKFVWQKKLFEVGASIGVVPITPASGPLGELLSAADSACYVAKDLGRNRVHVYQPDDLAVVRHQGEMEWVRQLREALDEQRFALYCQRIQAVSPERGDRPMFEVLLRLRDEAGQLVMPGVFLPAAERYNLMPALDRWVIATTLERLRELLRASLDVVCTINLSGQSLADERMLPFITDNLAGSGVPARSVCFEITETAAISHLDRALHFTAELKSAGFLLALDDFGSGLSSFSYLKHLPVDYLKIDGVFVKGIVADAIDRAMVESINHIGHVMGKKTIAEFAEDQHILALLAELKVDLVQGYAIERPHPIEDLLSRSSTLAPRPS